MPPTHVPKFPVVDPDPSMRRAIGNFGLKDVGYIFAFTTSGYAVGWFGGKYKLLTCLQTTIHELTCFFSFI